MNYDNKEESPFDQFLNLSGSESNLNSPVVGAPNPYLSQQGLYQQPQQPQQQLTRPVPGLKTDYNLQKASSKTDLTIDPYDNSQQVPQIHLPQQQHQQHQQHQQPKAPLLSPASFLTGFSGFSSDGMNIGGNFITRGISSRTFSSLGSNRSSEPSISTRFFQRLTSRLEDYEKKIA